MKKKYPYKSATINYQQKDSKNFTTVNFDNYGELEYIKVVHYIMGKETVNIIIIKDDIIYQYSPEINSGTKRKYTDFNQIRVNFANIDKIQNSDKVTVEKLDDEIVLDKNCKVYKVISDGYSKQYSIWENILLKEKTTFSELTAVEIIENPNLDQNIFELPKDVDFIEF